MPARNALIPLIALSLLAGSIAACSNEPVSEEEQLRRDRLQYDPDRRAQLPDDPDDRLFGSGGLLGAFGGGDDDGPGETGIGVNSYLWRAALDTVAFMPVTSADPFGGVIITDWYTPPESPDERFKLNIYVLDRTLRADGIRVAVFRQIREGGEWVDAPVAEGTAGRMEEAILTRAREFRLATLQSQ